MQRSAFNGWENLVFNRDTNLFNNLATCIDILKEICIQTLRTPAMGESAGNSLSMEGVKSDKYMAWKGWTDAGHTEISQAGSAENRAMARLRGCEGED